MQLKYAYSIQRARRSQHTSIPKKTGQDSAALQVSDIRFFGTVTFSIGSLKDHHPGPVKSPANFQPLKRPSLILAMIS